MNAPNLTRRALGKTGNRLHGRDDGVRVLQWRSTICNAIARRLR